MELIPARLLQPCAEAAINARPLTKRELEMREHLIDAARRMFIQWGRMRVDVAFLAHSTRIPAITIRRHFGDMHHMFGLILREHVMQIYKAIIAVDGEGEDLMVRRRAEYFRVTRSYGRVPSSLHFLLVKDRVTLPQDELEPIENYRSMIAGMLGGEHGDYILMMLDHPTMDLAKAEALVATLHAVEAQRAEPKPERRLDPPAQTARPPLPTRKPTPVPPSRPPSQPPIMEPDTDRPADPLAALSDDDLRGLTSPTRKPPPKPPQPPPEAPPCCLNPTDPPAPSRLRDGLRSSATTPPSPVTPDLVSKTMSPEALSLDSRPPGRMSARLAGPAA